MKIFKSAHFDFDIEHAVQGALKAYVEPLIKDGRGPRGLMASVEAAARCAAIRYAMVMCNHNQVRAAQMLDINRNTLRKYLRAAGWF